MKKNTVSKNNRYSRWVWAEAFLLLLDIYLPTRLNLDRLATTAIINIAFDWIAMFTIIIILNSCIRGRKTKSSGSFMRLTVITFFILFFEVGTWSVDGIACLRPLNYLCNICCNSAMLLNAVCYTDFMCDSAEIDTNTLAVPYGSIKVMLLLGIIAEVLNYRLGYFYTVDAGGIYSSNPAGIVIGYIPFLYILGYGCVFVLKQPIHTPKKLSYLIYAIVPLIISVWYTVTKFPPSLFMAPFFSLLIIYENIYVRQGQEMEQFLLESAKKDAALAWQRNQLTRSQIRPHFIFNCLGSIEQLCRIDAEEASIATHRFAKYLRVNMDALGKPSLIPFSDELEYIRNYIWLEKMRFDEDLDYTEEIETTSFHLPPLSIQPIVENAVKHGMMGKEDGTLSVTLRVFETAYYYEIQIEDDGNGFDVNRKIEDGRSHVGIQYVTESLSMSVNGELKIHSQLGKGTLAVIQIPKKKTEQKEEDAL